MKGWTGEAGHARSLVVRALLNRPLILTNRANKHVVDLAHAHYAELRSWFDHHLGWQLRVDRDRIRLFKIPEAPGRQGNDAPTARECALYCLTLAVLEDCGHQTVISELAEKITALTETHSVLRAFDATVRRERADLVAMVRLLVSQGVLTPERDRSLTREDEREYIQGSGDALYAVDHRTAALMIASPVPPALAGGPQGLIAETDPDHTDTAERAIHHALMRRFVDDPVVYFDDLPDEQRSYFHTHADELIQAVRRGLDCRVELRTEGVAIIDEDLTDLEFPKSSTPSFAALVLADALAHEAGHAPQEQPVVPEHRVRELAADVAATLLRLAQKINNHPIDAERTLEAAVPILNRLNLIQRLPEGIRVRPALARYRAPHGQGARKVQKDLMLFGHDDLTTSPSENGADDHRN
ncbi:TIGR02678 family protein [Streptomyces sp. NPDC059875]|uniref:TIGR02678 family protein n=1 Tax=unclassified Streptomyces TaxID=2593676 RepID=UPI0036658C34